MAPGHLYQMVSRLECWISLKRLARLTRRTGEEPMILNRRHGLDLGLVLLWLCSRLLEPTRSPFENLRANGVWAKIIGVFPFVLRLSKHEIEYFSNLLALRYALMPSTLRSYSLITLSRTTLSITGLGKWPSSSAITWRECGQVDAAWG